MSWRSFKKDVIRTESGELRGPPLHEKFEADLERKERRKNYKKEANFDSRFKSRAFSQHHFKKASIIQRYPRASLFTFTFLSLGTLYSRYAGRWSEDSML